ncbi:hypothetical protein MRB53_010448 [Persea americana]|uniref:Uncharacterized protein n=1 Tax=Persea americana TaxID=3435 RepID=A0ACC2LRY9_PERAE|nr:hypothetical protein MRB53_010448 [Persea americana]
MSETAVAAAQIPTMSGRVGASRIAFGCISEDDNMHFSSNPNIATDEDAQESDIVFRKYLDAVESDDEVEAINIEDDHPTKRAHGGALNRATVGAKSDVAEPSTHRREVIF